jgi:exodeoxyribonuclease V beta subunit
LRFATLEGYLRGFVDLIVRSRGRYYVIDWKSNVLGDTADDYVPSALDAAMTANGYHLQHLLYTVALHRWLRRRLPGYDYDTHLGGTRYLFIRAVRPDWPQAGIYADRPPRALIEGLSALLDPPGSRP